jgi:hypothetical protein
VTALAEIISEVCGALGVGVEVLTDSTMLIQLPNDNDGLPGDLGVLDYHGIRGSELAIDVVVSGLFGVSSLPSPDVALCRAEKTNCDKCSVGVRSRPDVRFIKLRWRRSGGGPGGGCACMHVSTYLYLHVVGASNHVAVLSLGR